MPVKSKPDAYHSVTPYLVADGAVRLIDFAKPAFGARETERLAAPGGRIGHAELRIGDSLVMLADAYDGREPMLCMLHLYVDDADVRSISARSRPGRPRWRHQRTSFTATAGAACGIRAAIYGGSRPISKSCLRMS